MPVVGHLTRPLLLLLAASSSLMCAQVMRRTGKLMYEWVGFDHLPALLKQLSEDESNGGWPLLFFCLQSLA